MIQQIPVYLREGKGFTRIGVVNWPYVLGERGWVPHRWHTLWEKQEPWFPSEKPEEINEITMTVNGIEVKIEQMRNGSRTWDCVLVDRRDQLEGCDGYYPDRRKG